MEAGKYDAMFTRTKSTLEGNPLYIIKWVGKKLTVGYLQVS